ncbi:nucleoside phosphorylase [Aequorivita echinoideorum]|uniref:Uridine phosphorylase n=1 Tax=Aequorivita echinoideorum TaxID=1549647 RepID=A0ABS5S647_9FLAO|nr:nucleoside phosphorylase [Aequorivita echinoideorum]MBT0608693.1 nucleoside phosphorylase [Aequorivita echinoideorum]
MKSKTLSPSELILNPDGSIYHLNLLPEQLADTIITVGDPDRVGAVSKYFDTIEFEVQKREFKTHTGTINGKRISVISTGIGTDNIDIVFNELDALKNIDFKTRTVKNELTSLEIIRIGTSGAIQPEIEIDSFMISEKAIGFDSLLHFYGDISFCEEAFSEAFISQSNWNPKKSKPYVVSADENLLEKFSSEKFIKGITATNVGFYGPQGRTLRLSLEDETMNEKIRNFRFRGKAITNLEMETSGIYGMAKLLGHRAISLNAILANRANGTFSKNPEKTIDSLIKSTLEIIS